MNIARQRLANQQISAPTLARPADVVAGLGAIQAQDYLGALWAIGLRLTGATEATVEQALLDRSIVRTWPMRGTLHVIAAADVHWMLRLMAPRALAQAAGRFRQLGLDEDTFTRSRDVCSAALQGGKQLVRAALYQALEAAHIATDGQRGIHILWRLAHEELICYGARAGKQQTFALLDEWIPRGRSLPRDEALAELARRYVAGHGPAMLQDFVWWSGLSMSDARAGLDAARPRVAPVVHNGQTHWLTSSIQAANDAPPAAHLLPAFDEYLVGYKDRSAVLDPQYARQTNNGGGILSPVIVIDGRVVGTWKRALTRGSVTVALSPFTALSPTDEHAVALAAQQYGAFLGLPVTLI